MNCTIFTIGTELLMGATLNTNSEYLSKTLNDIGVNVLYHVTVGDNPKRIQDGLLEYLDKSDIIITTGGLGPTQDDISKELVAKALGRKMILDEEIVEDIREKFKKFGKEMTENNMRQAYMPEGCTVLYNHFGTAPGVLLDGEINGKRKIIIMLPGPPREVKPMFEDIPMKYLKEAADNNITSKYVRMYGMGESEVENRLLDLINNQTNPTIATYVKNSEVMVRVTASGKDDKSNMVLIDQMIEKVKEIIGDCVYSTENEELTDMVCRMLVEKNLTISTAESCTGGLIAKTLTDYPGISSIFNRGYVTYSNEAKAEDLGVDCQIIESHGAVSEETAYAMAKGLYDRTGSDICVSVTGIAGPEGGTPEKPVGLVYCGFAFKGEVEVHKYFFTGERERVRLRTTLTVFDNIRKRMLL